VRIVESEVPLTGDCSAYDESADAVAADPRFGSVDMIVNLATPTARPGSASPLALGRGLSFVASFECVFHNGGRRFGAPGVRVAGIELGRSVRFERGSRV
jgi:hypothetical protein